METHVENKCVATESSTGDESEPYVGMLFESEQAARAFYDGYAKQLGFLTRIVSSRKSERDGSIISRRLACNKEGFNLNSKRKGQVQIRKRESKREGCMAMMSVKKENPGQWVVTKFVKDHNHPPLISSAKVQAAPLDDKDRKIKELSSELHHANQCLAAYQERLQALMTYIEEHTECLSRTVEDAVQNIGEAQSQVKTQH